MTRLPSIFRYISSLAINLLLALPVCAQADRQMAADVVERDSTAWLKGFAVGVDLAGLVQYAISDYGQFEAQLRINLRDRYFPVFEAGVGRARHDDIVTLIHYRSTAPYFRIGADYNLMKNKHDFYRIYGGARYALSYFKYDVSHPGVTDPNWGDVAPYGADGVSAHCHWAELSVGVDATIWSVIHLGWSVRYRKRLFHSDGDYGNVWYVPGFGRSGSTRIGYTFMLAVDI